LPENPEEVMTRLVFMALALLTLSAGCAAGGYSQAPEPYYPAITDVPPAFYDNDPNLRYWFTAPYWNPSIGE
jgi:hypothetical protein